MLFAYVLEDGRLHRMPHDAPLEAATWIDVYRPTQAQEEALKALGIALPTLDEMQALELSNRLYRAGAFEFMTATMPGQTPDGVRVMGPVTLVLSPHRLVTLRHHDPRPFRIYPQRAETKAAGATSVDRVFLGLIEEFVARLADLLEASDQALELAGQGVFADGPVSQAQMRAALGRLAAEGETLSRVRLALMTLERVLSYFNVRVARKREDLNLTELVSAQMRDIDALEEHANFLSGRLGQISDATLALINLAQNSTARILSIVAMLFLPPTLVASVYGMNFANLPGLEQPSGYLIATGLMLGSVLGTYLFFRWKGWL